MLVDETNLIDPWRLALKYNQSPNIRQIYDGLGAIFDNHSLWDFYKFFDTDQAFGVWLDKLGALYNIARPIALTGEVFVLDVDGLDNPSVLLDGLTAAISDKMFRRLIQIKMASNLEMPSVDSISDLFERVFGGPDLCRCEIEEEYMSFVVNLYFADPLDIKVMYTVLDINPNVIGEFPGVSYRVVPHLMYPPQN